MYNLVPTSTDGSKDGQYVRQLREQTQSHLSVGYDCVRNQFGWFNCRSETRRSKAEVADFPRSINTTANCSAIVNLPLQSPLPSVEKIRTL